MARERNPINKQTILIVVLAMALIIVLGIYGFEKYKEVKDLERQALLQQGAQIGYQQAVLQIMQQAYTCQPFPVFFENQTLNLIAVECIQAAQQQAQG